MNDFHLSRSVLAKYYSDPRALMEIRDDGPWMSMSHYFLRTWIEEREMLGLSQAIWLRNQLLTEARAVLACLWLASCYI
jgi:hypothetical protein